MSKTPFIVIEGIDGAGTTTQSQELVRRLNEAGHPALFTYEPTSGPVGSLIKQVLNRRLVAPLGEDRFESLNADTMSLLFSADRLDHLQTVILPALKKGITVVSDRYDYSTAAYQGVGGDMEWIRAMNTRALRPDLIFFLRVSADIALKRIADRHDLSIYEKRDFLGKVAANYDRIFDSLPGVMILDGTRPKTEVAEAIWNKTSELFGGKV